MSYSAAGYGGMPYVSHYLLTMTGVLTDIPQVFMSSQDVQALRLCDYTGIAVTTNSTINVTAPKSSAPPRIGNYLNTGILATISTATALAAYAVI